MERVERKSIPTNGSLRVSSKPMTDKQLEILSGELDFLASLGRAAMANGAGITLPSRVSPGKIRRESIKFED